MGKPSYAREYLLQLHHISCDILLNFYSVFINRLASCSSHSIDFFSFGRAVKPFTLEI